MPDELVPVAPRTKIREASRHVVIVAVVAPKDGSGPCRSVGPKKREFSSISLNAHELTMKLLWHPLSSTRDGRATAEAGGG